MKQKIKTTINISGFFPSAAIIVAVFVAIFIFGQTKVFAQAVTPGSVQLGSYCQSDADCNSGSCNINSSISSVNKVCVIKCATGYVWNSVGGACELVGGTSTVPNSTAPTTQTSSGNCPSGSSDPNNTGVCIPNNNAGGGIAGQKTLTGLILVVIQLLLTFAGLIAIVVLILGGFWYITSAGNEETAEKGQKAITNAIIGLVAVLLSYAIVTIIVNTLTSAQVK